ncbi:MAG: amidohydrolase family protein [Deltaproteobacteria bacterium]|nr:amidohydrolase family protein [Deltaproteobacteria bacterium]
MEFDFILESPLVYDGTGQKPFRKDVGVANGKVADIGDLSQAQAKTRIPARDLAVCPGFIDVHTHADLALHRPEAASILEPLVRQGITTFIGGNCGVALGPISDRHPDMQFEFFDIFMGGDQRKYVTWQGFGEMLEALQAPGLVQNVGILAPHGMIRSHAMGDDTRLAEPRDIAIMKKALAGCMEAGAFGLSTGLMYFPGLCSDERELLELGRVVHDYNGVFTSHLRSYNSDTLANAMDEVLTVGRKAEIPVQISHLFWVPNFPQPWGYLAKKAVKALSAAYNLRPFPFPIAGATRPYLEKVADLVDQGFPVGVDAMPTSAGFTHLFAFFPPWSLQGGMKSILARIADPATRKEIKRSIEKGKPVWPHRDRDAWSMNLFKVMGWDCAYVMSVASDENQHLVGKNFVEIGRETGKHPFDAACDLALEESGRVLIFETATYPGDPFVELSLKETLVDKNVSIATDTIPMVHGRPSHLTYDCYPKFLSRYTGDKGFIPLQEGIRKCTSLPASQLGVPLRGTVAPGYWADLVVFSPARLGTNSTALDPEHFPPGIEYVLVNGEIVVDPQGYHPERRPGRMMRRGEG